MGTTRNKKIREAYSIREAALAVRLKQSELKEFAKEGIFHFHDSKNQKIDRKNFERLRVAASLKKELDVNAAGIDVILHLLDKVSEMSRDYTEILKGVKGNFESKVRANLKKIKNH
jgi:hypothetical protein